jgi:hypothetical protein
MPAADPVDSIDRGPMVATHASTPALGDGSSPFLPVWGHVVLALFTCGLSLIVGRALKRVRQGQYKAAMAWGVFGGLTWLLVIGALAQTDDGGQSPSPTAAASPSVRSLLDAGAGQVDETTSTTTTTTTTTTTRPTPTAPSKPKVQPKVTTSKPRPTTTRPKPKPTRAKVAAPALDPRFGTCREAIAHGYGNYRRGVDPEYDWYRDADSDGIVCEH